MIKRGLEAVERKDTLGQIRADEAFHKLIYEASGNPLLTGTAEVHWRFLRRVMSDVLFPGSPTAGFMTVLASAVMLMVIYQVWGYPKGGNLQIHPLTGYDDGGIIPIAE